ncbi:transposable element Tcb1 transposase [Trichonephila clavipes]|nr:transposable element Tcb1 transposase [Trichonephila clavipes]
MINGRTRLHVVANGTMTGQRYIDEVLIPHVRLFRGAVGDKFVFMDDNATYLNPIENVWDALERQVAGRNYPPTNKNTLIRALTEEWDKLPQQLLDNVVQSMPNYWKDRRRAKISDVARKFNITHRVVPWLWKSFKTTGLCSRRHGGGRVRSTTPAEDRYIVLSAKRNRRTTAQQVANQFLAASGKQISRKTVARRLRERELYARRPVVCVPLTRQHRTVHESRFSLSSDCRHQLIWRESGTAYRSENIQKKDRYPTCSIMVWAGIMINGRTRLHVVANGTMTGQRYIDEVLIPHVRLFRGDVGDKFVFMDDNATYLNPIENVWDALERQVAGRNYPPTNKNTLIRALTEEWDKLPQQLLDNVVQSMVRRVECCITLHGGYIPLLTFRCIVPFLRTQIK